ncbi:hypothetical protein AB0392_02880 [Nonomuraea angiospora]|uniref:hypothetical protein n=1 Tax=Nonomuraea angiospora TaxID=46172 RepID=UPI00344FAB6E
MAATLRSIRKRRLYCRLERSIPAASRACRLSRSARKSLRSGAHRIERPTLAANSSNDSGSSGSTSADRPNSRVAAATCRAPPTGRA